MPWRVVDRVIRGGRGGWAPSRETSGRLGRLAHRKGGCTIRTVGTVNSKRQHAKTERNVITLRKHMAALFADRSSRRWIVRDPEGNFWLLPPVENPWDHREPYQPSEDSDLEPVPGHYKDMLGLPF